MESVAASARAHCKILLAMMCVIGLGNSALAVAGDGGARELVQVERPEPLDGMHALIRNSAYEMCANTAKLMDLPVKPFPPTPADFLTERITVIADASHYLRKVEHPYSEVVDRMTPQDGCEYRIEPNQQVDITIVNGDKMTSVTRDMDGQWQVHEDLATGVAKLRRDDLSNYSTPLTINGVSLRCLPTTDPIISPNDLQALCVDGSETPVSDAEGKPVVLYSRNKPMGINPDEPYVVILEPVSLKSMAEIDPKVFDPASYAQ
ncbi:hypothetical protein [Pseudomonas sp. 6D_7.1_Bac1]|uniref:hypothetical protein n=1 Tax=Pseudomonas sp. 6D_7.1_Bac1 TaxID=2971615 RepID=UPI0021C7824F|nr:hypothetical protein [Pseudomonas sp. 6D_7.1_Bac1]MCU1751845.1 hypothetical protein [Pseudomonas sp. 6D_7.1_Bac1]